MWSRRAAPSGQDKRGTIKSGTPPTNRSGSSAPAPRWKVHNAGLFTLSCVLLAGRGLPGLPDTRLPAVDHIVGVPQFFAEKVGYGTQVVEINVIAPVRLEHSRFDDKSEEP